MFIGFFVFRFFGSLLFIWLSISFSAKITTDDMPGNESFWPLKRPQQRLSLRTSMMDHYLSSELIVLKLENFYYLV